MVTEAGNDPKVAGVVYIAAFAPDKGESVASLIANLPPSAAEPPILPPQDGFLMLDKPSSAPASRPMWNSIPRNSWPIRKCRGGVAALEGAVTVPAWKSKPSWYLVATDDHMIPPPAQRDMAKRAGSTVKEVKGNHAIYVSNPQAVAKFIEQAAVAAHK